MFSPYINRFLQPDTLIPGVESPQNWNRYSYVSNSPIIFNDPTGHMQVNDGESNRGSNCSGIFAKYCNKGKPKSKAELIAMRPPKPKPVENWEFDFDAVSSTHIGPAQDTYSPDYHGDYPDDHNVPYIPGVSPINNPNPCVGAGASYGPAIALCAVSLFTSFSWSASSHNPNDNFFLAYHLNYSSQTGLTVSDMKYKSLYGGQAAIDYIQINKHTEFQSPNYLPTDGYYRPVSMSGGTYHGNGNITIDLRILYVANTANGVAVFPQMASFIIPSYDSFKNVMGIK
jgi:hypothetical protein